MMDLARLISIVIPAYNRADTLYEALQSCFAQAYRPLEIVIGDDSTSDAVATMVAALTPPDGITIRYERHAKRHGQSGNVNWLLAAARGLRTMLLHDDDLLLPGGLDRLVETWVAYPRAACVFGKQIVILENGDLDMRQTIDINTMYFRAGRPTGPLRPTQSVGLLQQIPNNCYLIDTALARSIGYRPEAEIGYPADADFGIRLSLAMEGRDFAFLADYVSAYRITHGSMMRTTRRNQDHHLIYRFVESIALPAEAEPARALFLDRHGPPAVLDAANAGDLALARRILVSGHYGRSLTGVHALLVRLSIAAPRLGVKLRPYFKTGTQAIQRMRENRRNRRAAAPVPIAPAERAEHDAVAALADETARLNTRRRAAYQALAGERVAA